MSLRPPITRPDLSQLKDDRDGWIRLATVALLFVTLAGGILGAVALAQGNAHTGRILHGIQNGQDITHSELQQVTNNTACLIHPVPGVACSTIVTETVTVPSPYPVPTPYPSVLPVPSPYAVPTIVRVTTAPSPSPVARPGAVVPPSASALCPFTGTILSGLCP